MAPPMRGTILFVDDDDDTASMLAEILTLRGFAASWVTSAEACLQQLSGTAIDVVITDVRMSGMSGIELCGLLHDHHPEVVTIVVTGDLTRNRAREARNAGAYEFLAKPIKIADLDAVLTRAASIGQLRREVLHPRIMTEDAVAPDPMGVVTTVALSS